MTTIWCASSKVIAREKVRRGNPSPELTRNVFFTLAFGECEPVWSLDLEGAGFIYQIPWPETKSSITSLLSGWSIMGGLVRPPSMPGRSLRYFFPHFLLKAGSPEISKIYEIAVHLADHYNVTIAAEPEAMAPCLVNEWHLRNLPGLKENLEN